MAGSELIAGSAPIVMWATLIVFNAAVIKLLQIAFSSIDLKMVLREKATSNSRPDSGTGVPSIDNTSYSRVAGMIGSIIIACFFWALGNIILYKAFGTLSDISTLLSGVWSFLVAGASLFVPYGFNQITQAFKPS